MSIQSMRVRSSRSLPILTHQIALLLVIALVFLTVLGPKNTTSISVSSLPAVVDLPFIPTSDGASSPITAPRTSNFEKLPLSFIPNVGQTDDSAVRFQASGMGGMLYFTSSEVVLSLPTPKLTTALQAEGALPDTVQGTTTLTVVRLRFEGANLASRVTGTERLPGIINYMIGNDPSTWHTNIPTYAGIIYQNLYDGIDLRYDSINGQLKGTYIVTPGKDPSRIHWYYDGASSVRIDTTGDLQIVIDTTNIGSVDTGKDATIPMITLTEKAPVAWQTIDGQRILVDVRYSIGNDNRVGFLLGTYDPTQPLTIDPTLTYSTYLGGSGGEAGFRIAVDSSGNVYVTGNTLSSNFPTANPLQSTKKSYTDVFITKLNPDGSMLIYSTYLGGNSFDYGNSIAVDKNKNVYVTGRTESTNFPTVNPRQNSNRGGSDVFITKLNASGNSLIYSTYLGGNSNECYIEGCSIALDSSGNAYITGFTSSTNFPTVNPFQSTYKGGSTDAFVTKLNTSGSSIIYSTYLGGSSYDYSEDIAVDSAGNVYITGYTNSTNFPTASPLQSSNRGGDDAFITKLSANGKSLVYSTYLGGNISDYALGIAVDNTGSAYITGSTYSTNFPTANPFKGSKTSNSADAFITKLSANGSTLAYSTYFGGNGYVNQGNGIAVDSLGHAYVIGQTDSANLPTTSPYQGSNSGFYDAFITKLNPSGNLLTYSTYLGGKSFDKGNDIAVDSDGNAYVIGYTESTNFPVANSRQAIYGGGTDAFIAKLFSTGFTLSGGEIASYEITNTTEGQTLATDVANEWSTKYGINIDPVTLRVYDFDRNESSDILIVPNYLSIEKVFSREDSEGGTLGAEFILPSTSQSSTNSTALSSSDGITAGEPEYWQTQNTGCLSTLHFKKVYLANIVSVGNGTVHTCWSIGKLQAEAISDKDYFSLDMRAIAHADGQIPMKQAKIWSHPYASPDPANPAPEQTWVDWSPREDTSRSECGTIEVGLSEPLRLPVAGNVQFPICETWDITHNPFVGGDFANEWRSSLNKWDVDREVAFMFSISVPEGKKPKWHVTHEWNWSSEIGIG